jgi:hypothetical protein
MEEREASVKRENPKKRAKVAKPPDADKFFSVWFPNKKELAIQ